MSQFIIQDKSSEFDDFKGEIVMSTATDFVSLYGLLAVNNPLNDKQFTVGGAHRTDGSEGLPTGHFGELEYIKLDNKVINSNGIYAGNNLVFKMYRQVELNSLPQIRFNSSSQLRVNTLLFKQCSSVFHSDAALGFIKGNDFTSMKKAT